jgi:hypothetical protein
MESAKKLAALLERYPESVQSTARAARRFVLAILPGATELVDNSAPVIGYGYGTGYRDMTCTLILSQRGVKLGLVGGADLSDPRHLEPRIFVGWVSSPWSVRRWRPGMGAPWATHVAGRRQPERFGGGNSQLQSLPLPKPRRMMSRTTRL